MKVRELIGRLVRETDLNDTITVFDMDGNEFKDLAVEKLGTNVLWKFGKIFSQTPKKGVF